MRAIVCLTFPDGCPPISPVICARLGQKLEPRCHGEGLFASSHAVEPCERTLCPALSFVCVPLICPTPTLPQTSALLEKRPLVACFYTLTLLQVCVLFYLQRRLLCSLATQTRADVFGNGAWVGGGGGVSGRWCCPSVTPPCLGLHVASWE